MRLKIFAILTGLVGSLFTVNAAEPTTIKQPDWSRNAVIYEVNWRQITEKGTLAQLNGELPRLKELGVDLLWFMPVNPISMEKRKGELGSYYAVRNYTDLNPELGTLGEFKGFIANAHEQGFKVIIDWVPNHSGCDNPWVEAHPDWYKLNEEGKMYGPYDWTDVYQFDYANRELREAMYGAMKFWVEEIGVDGFRCDVASMVPVDFWNEVRQRFDKEFPGQVFMLAEASAPDLNEHAFNMSYNWPMKDVFNAIAATAGQRNFGTQTLPEMRAAAIDELLAKQAEEYPADSYMMNHITNHDLNSWEGTEFQRLGNLTNAFAVLCYTLPGMPLIYTGQEVGMDRAFEFFVKDVPPTFEPRNDYFKFYQKLNALKHNEKALQAGTAGGKMVRYATTSPDLYIFSRTVGDSNVLVMVNIGAEAADVVYTGKAPATKTFTTDYFRGVKSALPIALAPGEYFVFTSGK